MTVQILIDLSHNESYRKIPNDLFDLDYLFQFTNPSGSFPNFDELIQYDILIIGEIIPAKEKKDHLFFKEEIRTIKKYVQNGGNLLISTSSGGDFDYLRTEGSLRALYKITGIKRFWWGELFNKEEGKYVGAHENIVFSKFPSHKIFNGVQKLILADCTFLEVDEELEDPEDAEVKILLECEPDSFFRYYTDDFVEKIGKEPVITLKKTDEGKCLTIGSTLFMTDDEKYGIGAENNGIFFKNIIQFLLD